MRKHIVAGNWKMNNSIQEGLELVKEITDKKSKRLYSYNKYIHILNE